MKAMIFAAGLGTRLKPITNSIPKALVPINGKPLLEHVIQKLKLADFDEIIINVHHFPDQIINFLKSKNNFDIHIEISDERDELLDTGGGIKKAAHFFNDGKPFLVHNVDILSNVDLKNVYNQHLNDENRLCSLIVSNRNTNRYLLFNRKEHLCGWVNMKTGKTKPFEKMDILPFQKLAYAGIQVVSPKIFELMEKKPNKFPIMDFYLQNCCNERIVGYVPQNLSVLDVGKLNSLESAEDFVAHYSLV
ncbi:MAG: nucleotidyltransferase family protein [Paludibacteraceae bacterium]